MTIRKRVYDILDPGHADGVLSRTVNYVIYGLIFLSVIAIVLDSVASVYQQWATAFRYFEVLTVLVFSVEYLLRLWCCVESPKYAAPVRGRLRYLFSPLALIDLLSILPFYLPFVTADMRFLRSIRFIRLFRLAKLGRYSTAFRVLGEVVHAKRAELIVSGSIVILLTVIFAIGMFYTEHEAQPEVFPDIPSAMYWAVATLTNMGHPDPITTMGRCMAAAMFFLELGMLAIPTGVLGAGFVEEFRNRNRQPVSCPHCGKEIQPKDAA